MFFPPKFLAQCLCLLMNIHTYEKNKVRGRSITMLTRRGGSCTRNVNGVVGRYPLMAYNIKEIPLPGLGGRSITGQIWST